MAACVVLAAAATGGDRDVAEFLFKKAEKAYRAKDYESAASDYARARKEYTPHPPAAYGLALALEKLGREPEAIAAYRQCIAEVDAAAEPSWKWKTLRRKSAAAVKRMRRRYAELDRLNRDLIERCLAFGKEHAKASPQWAAKAFETVLRLDPAHVGARRALDGLERKKPAPAPPPAKAAPKDWGRSLVRGDDLEGWDPGLRAPWTCENGVISADVEGRSGKLNWLDDTEFEGRYELRIRLRVARDGGAGRTYGFMLGNGRDWHALLVQDSNDVVLLRSEDDEDTHLKDAIPRDFNPHRWHVFRLKADRGTLTVYLDDKELFEHTADDRDAFDGKLALFAQNGRIVFERLEVRP